MKQIKQMHQRWLSKSQEKLASFHVKAKKFTTSESGQGTTEYAILVGVMVVIAIVAIMIFKPKLEELWNSIAEGINGL